MSAITVFKTSEKVLIWLHRSGNTQVWLAKQMNTNRQAIAKKIEDNIFTPGDILTLSRLGCPL